MTRESMACPVAVGAPFGEAPRANLNGMVRKLAKALGKDVRDREVENFNGTTTRWPLFGGTSPHNYHIELWTGYARCLQTHGQMAVATLYEDDHGFDNIIYQSYLVNPDHELLNRDKARVVARQRMTDWLQRMVEKVRAGDPLVLRDKRPGSTS